MLSYNYLKGEKDKDKILYKLQEEYKSYRKKWVNILDSYKIDSNFKPGSKISIPTISRY